MFSDGFYSQFDNTGKELIRIKRFREYIQEIHNLTLEQQKQKLISFLYE